MAVEDLYSKACEAVERAKHDYAIKLLREVLRQRPDYPDARILLRGTERRRLEEKGRSPLARLGAPPRVLATSVRALLAGPRKKLEIFEDHLQRSPSSSWALMKAAGAARKAGFDSEAVQIYKDALRLKPSAKKTLRALGNILRETGQHQEAVKYLIRLSNLEPTDRDLQDEVRDLSAMDHMAAHEMETADSFMDLVRDRDEAARLEASGRMAVTMDDLRRQVVQAEKELAEHPDNVNQILNLSKLYLDTGQLPKAQKLLREKHQQMPDDYDIREGLGDVQIRAYDQALASAAKRLEGHPQDAEATRKKEELSRRRTQFAIKEFTWRISQRPTDRQLHLQLGKAQFEADQYNEAIASFQNSLQDARYEEESSKRLGACFMHKGQHDLALAQFERAIELHGQMDEEGKDLCYQKALAYEEMGSREEALDLYKKIYSQDINFRDVAQKVESLSG